MSSRSARVIDGHLHLDPAHYTSPAESLRAMSRGLKSSGIERGMLLQLATQSWSREEIGEALRSHAEIVGLVSIHPHEPHAADVLKKFTREYPYKGLKLHPRLDRFSVSDPKTHALVRHAGALGLPVVIDAFPDGYSIMDGFEPRDYAELCKAAPETRVVVAHFGGIRVLDFLLLGKRVPNMYFNIAYSLLYFRGSSVTQDMIYAIRSLRGEKILYGSDYPDRGIEETLQLTYEEFERAHLPAELIQKVMYSNAAEFFKHYGWST